MGHLERSEVVERNKRMGERLRRARHARGLSLSELAAETGGVLEKSCISNYEQGIRRMGIEQAELLAQALVTVSAQYLLCLDDDGFLSEEERDVVERLRRTDARGRETVRAVLGALDQLT
ncbi:Transcriptional regulator, XRE family (fragment) [Thiocapsa sp. KS1]